MKAQKEAPTHMQCKDKFVLQSIIAHDGASTKDFASEMFNKEGKVDEEFKQKVIFSPVKPPPSVPEEFVEGSPPHGNGKRKFLSASAVARYLEESKEKSSEELEVDCVAQRQGFIAYKRRRIQTHTSYLPKDIILKILALLPAEVLHNAMRYVCREWYHMIQNLCFVNAHLQHQTSSSTGIIAQDYGKDHAAFYVTIDDCRFRVKKLPLPLHGQMFGSCDGLVLLYDKRNRYILHVANPITKKTVSLPPLVRERPLISEIWSTMACTTRGEYKVVHVAGNFCKVMQVSVCTVGVDNDWRPVEIGPDVSSRMEKFLLFCKGLYIAGFIYWIRPETRFCIAMDVETERMYKFATPQGFEHGCSTGSRVNMVTTVGLVNFLNSGSLWRFWELKEVKSGGGTASWTNVYDIDMGGLCGMLGRRMNVSCPPPECPSIMPLVCLRNGELWFHICSPDDERPRIVCYDPRKDEESCLYNITLGCNLTFCFHVNTLVLPPSSNNTT